VDNDLPKGQKRHTTPGVFLTTRWSRVIMAGDSDHPEAHAALSSLCDDYWRPLYYFARRKGHSPEDAQDLTQGFIMGLVETDGIATADQERGRFRSFLIGAFCNYLANERRAQSAQKRGGSHVVLPLDEYLEAGFQRHASHALTPELIYDRSWAFAILERVMGRLAEEYAKANRTPVFEAIRPHLSGALGRPGYATLCQSLGMSENAVTLAMRRMRRRYGEFLREEIAATVASPEEVEDELRHLMKIVSGPQN
jgi:DNA-directed RNA polymerase specialized sigma24 family protein